MKSMLHTSVALAALAAILGSATAANAARAYVGTYTADPAEPRSAMQNHGEGIYLVDVDDATGAPSNPKLVAKLLSPSWLALSADHKFLYAVSEVANFGADKHGSVTAFAVDGASGALKKLNTVDSGGAIPCFISLHPSGKFAMVANYTGGSYEIIRIKPDGSLGEITDVVKPGGPLSPATAADTQPGQFAASSHEGSRGHMIGPDRSGQYVIGDDAGRDQIFVWKLDQASGKLAEVSNTKALPGAAPRHFVFSPDNKTMYQLQEQDSRLQVHDFKDGKLTPKGASVSALPDGYQGSNTSSELRIDAAGKHLYAGNRTQDSIATFAVTASGVSHIANTHTGGDNPRSLTIDPSGKFLYSLNQSASNIVTFRIGADGVPKPTGKYLAIGTPAVMVFLRNKETFMDKRQFLTAAAALAATPALAQQHKPGTDDLGRLGVEAPKKAPRRKATTSKLFLAPPCWANAISVEPGKGFWVQEQRHDNQTEKAWLLDFKTGKVLHTVVTNSKNTSGGVWGGGYIWSGANGEFEKNHPNPPINGIFQTDMNGKEISWRQIPFGPKDDGGSCHGMGWEEGKLWIYANRMESLIRIDAKSWETDFIFPVTHEIGRLHGITYDSGNGSGGVIWQVCGTQDPKVVGYDGYVPGLVKYDARSGKVLEIVDFVPGSCDIHDVTVWNGQLYGVDAGEHPGWPIDEKFSRPGFPELNSPSAGYIFKIDLI